MTKAPGVQLFKVWGDMDELDQIQVVRQLAEFEGEMTDIRFPASGSLYLRHSMAAKDACMALDLDMDPERVLHRPLLQSRMAHRSRNSDFTPPGTMSVRVSGE
jgi:hypothetical protein